MNLQNRVERLEQATGTGAPCPVCNVPREKEKLNYDENVWCVGESLEMNVNCGRCGRPRRIVFNVIKRRDEKEN